MATVTINGRKRHFSRITSVRRVGAAYHVETFHGTYTIDGGKRCGGSRSDWFVSGAHIRDCISCTSVLDALRLLETM
jgi:hypothetical protein